MALEKNEMETKIAEQMTPEFLDEFKYEAINFKEIEAKQLYFGTPPDTDQTLVADYIQNQNKYPCDWDFFIVEKSEQGYYVHDGNHKLEAIQIAKKTNWKVPCIIIRRRQETGV